LVSAPWTPKGQESPRENGPELKPIHAKRQCQPSTHFKSTVEGLLQETFIGRAEGQRPSLTPSLHR
jgi:hypothetical protein